MLPCRGLALLLCTLTGGWYRTWRMPMNNDNLVMASKVPPPHSYNWKASTLCGASLQITWRAGKCHTVNHKSVSHGHWLAPARSGGPYPGPRATNLILSPSSPYARKYWKEQGVCTDFSLPCTKDILHRGCLTHFTLYGSFCTFQMKTLWVLVTFRMLTSFCLCVLCWKNSATFSVNQLLR